MNTTRQAATQRLHEPGTQPWQLIDISVQPEGNRHTAKCCWVNVSYFAGSRSTELTAELEIAAAAGTMSSRFPVKVVVCRFHNRPFVRVCLLGTVDSGSPLHALKGNYRLTELLFKKHVLPEAEAISLHEAAWKGDARAVHLALNLTMPDSKDEEHTNPLYVSA